ncbi:hypothetical protein Tco_1048788 [Tanacetum coccineum]
MTEFHQLDSGLVVPVFNLGDDSVACLKKAMVFMSAVAALRFPSTNNQLRTSSNSRNQDTIQDGRVIVQQVQGRQEKAMLAEAHESNQILDEEQLAFLADPGITDYAYDSYCDDISSAKAVLMANLSNYCSDILFEVPNFETYQNDMDNQSIQAIQHFKQTAVDDYPDN